MNLKVYWDSGVVVQLGETTICLDPQTTKIPYDHILISHAHRDHTAGFLALKPKKYSTYPTIDIFEAVTRRKVNNVKRLSYGEKVKIGDFKVFVYNSGHILGSAMFKIETSEGTVLYTGDLNCVDTLITSAANNVQCDILIIESTYGNSGLVFPSREKIYRSMVRWVVEKICSGKIPIFYVYPVGKAQEVIRLLNEFIEVEVAVHPTIERVNRVYGKLNIKLQASIVQPKKGLVAVYPTYSYSSQKISGEVSAFATGWALRFKNKERFFPLSSHADFNQLLNFIKSVNPKIVYTVFGFTSQLAKHVGKKLNIKAKPLQI